MTPTPPSKAKSRYNASIALTTACVVLGCVSMFVLDGYGAPGRDEQFQTLCVREYSNAPLGLLVFWIGHLWTEWLGFSMLNLRILTSIESLLAVGVTSLFLYRRLRNPMLAGVVFLLGCILLRTTGFYLYNWDSGTYLFDAISICLLISCIQRPGTIKLIGLGVAIALMTLGRLPSGLFLPLALIIIWLSQAESPTKTKLNSMLTVSTGWLLTVILLTWIILGSPVRYIELLTGGNIVTGHSPVEDYDWIVYCVKKLVLTTPRYQSTAFACVIIAVACAKIKSRWNRVIWGCLTLWGVLFVALGFILPRGIYSHKWFFGYDMPFDFGLLIAVPIYNLFHKEKIRLNRETKLSLWACLALLAAMAFGSDAFWERCISGFIIPVLICLLWPVKREGFHRFMRYFVAVATITFCAIFIGHNISLWLHLKDMEPISGSKVMNGIRGSSISIDEALKSRDAINKVRKEGIPYIYLGNHLGANLETGQDEGFSFHNYHFQFTYYDYWQRFGADYIDKADAVIYLPDFHDYEYDLIVPELRTMGFTREEKEGDAIILYREPRKHPDKTYIDGH